MNLSEVSAVVAVFLPCRKFLKIFLILLQPAGVPEGKANKVVSISICLHLLRVSWAHSSPHLILSILLKIIKLARFTGFYDIRKL